MNRINEVLLGEIVLSTKKNTNLFTKVQQKVPIVLKFIDENCSGTYIGHTMQYTNNTELSTHYFDIRHNFDFRNMRILELECNYNQIEYRRTNIGNSKAFYKYVVDNFKS